MTRTITWPLLLTLTALLTSLYSTSPAQAATGCSFAAPIATVTIDAGASATLKRSGTALQLNGSNCGAATVSNTDTIVVTGAGGSETFTVDLSGGPLAPGASAEATGVAEIELAVDLGSQVVGQDKLVLRGTAGPDTYRLGSIGLNLNNDNDTDITGPGGGLIPTIGAELFSVLGAAGNDTISGEQAVPGSGSAVPAPLSLDLQGGDNDDTLKGGAYDDMLDGGLGADLIKGNAGIDTSTYATRGNRLRVDIGGALDGTDANNDGIAEEGDTTTTDVDNLIGGKGPDLLIGFDNRNVLTGNNGKDDLRGLGAIDTLDGGAGNDTLAGGARDDIEHGGPDGDTFDQGAAADGADDLFGEAGSDTVDYSARKDSVAIKIDGLANDGLDTNHDGVGLEEKDNIRTDIERVRGGQAADTLVGSNVANVLLGNGAGDFLDGGLGADLMDGGTGVDTVSYELRTDGVIVTASDSTANDGDYTTNEGDNVSATVENVRGGHSDDYLFGNAAANQLEGNDGADQLDGLGGADVMAGGPGIDHVIFATFDLQWSRRFESLRVTLDDVANDGTDLTLDGISEESDNVRSDVEDVDGSVEPDVLIGDSDGNRFFGWEGDDQLDGQGGPDEVHGFAGDDSLSGGDGTDTLFGDDGDDSLSGGDGTDTLSGSVGDDSLSGGDDSDTISGSFGNDSMIGGDGSDTLRGEDGNDDFFEDSAPNGADEIIGDSGLDTVHYSGRSWPVAILLDDLANDGDFATSEGDNIHSDVEDAVGGSGPDAFQGSSAVNHFYGGPGNDGMHGNGGSDLLFGGIDNDTLYGDSGDDALGGGPGNDSEQGGSGRDVMLEESGANGADTFSDSDFDATVDYSSRTTAIVVHMDGVANDGADANDDWIAEEGDNVDPSISVIDSGSGRDLLSGRTVHLPGAAGGPVLNGNIGNDYLAGGNGASGPNSFGTFLNGGAGDDWLEGSAWSDNLNGGPGNDMERGNDSDDTFFEGSGPNGADVIVGNGSCCGPGGTRDVVDYGARFDPVRVDLDDTADDGDSATGESDNVGSDVEVIRGGFGNDVLTGNAGGNIIYGNWGSDQIDGAPGPDILYGDDASQQAAGGNDTVDGGDGDDYVFGEGGSDTLFGGNGSDIITGGAGPDAMDGGANSDILHAQDGFIDTVDGGSEADAADFDANDVLSNIP